MAQSIQIFPYGSLLSLFFPSVSRIILYAGAVRVKWFARSFGRFRGFTAQDASRGSRKGRRLRW